MDKISLRIPEHVSKNGEIVEGYGKLEILQTGIVSLIGTGIGFLVMIFTKNNVAPVFGTVIAAAGGYVLTVKDRYSRSSLLDNLLDLRRFTKSQRRYEYRGGGNE